MHSSIVPRFGRVRGSLPIAALAFATLVVGSGCGGASGSGAAGGGGAAATSGTPSTSSDSSATSGTADTTTASGSTGAGGAPPCGGTGEACCANLGCSASLVCDGTTCGPAIAPFACPPNATGAVFVSEVAPPANLTPWAQPFASVTFANCGTTAWTAGTTADAATGVKLGPSTPHDSDLWTPPRIALAGDVAPGFQVTVVVPIHVTPLTGNHAYAYELVDEGVAWLGNASPTHTIDVEAEAAAPVALCAGNMVDPSGAQSASDALQACIDAAPSGSTLALPPGIYRMTKVVTIDKPLTLTTLGATGDLASCLSYEMPKCAVLRADDTVTPSSAGTRGFLRLGSLATQVTAVTLDHVLVDGARESRLASASATNCAQGQNGDGINIGANCASCAVVGSASARALCGSGLEWDGDGITVSNSVFFQNGDHDTQNMWSDGLTIHKSDNANVTHCRFVDDSDVGFISGGGTGSHYTDNYAAQITQSSFAAMMLDNFNSPALGDFTGTNLSGNTVVCAKACHFGIELGPHPWYPSPNIQGGSVTGNTVVGGHIEINAQGAGTVQKPTVISGNVLGPTPASATFNCGAVSGLSPLNVSAESHVDLQGDNATGSIAVPCP